MKFGRGAFLALAFAWCFERSLLGFERGFQVVHERSDARVLAQVDVKQEPKVSAEVGKAERQSFQAAVALTHVAAEQAKAEAVFDGCELREKGIAAKRDLARIYVAIQQAFERRLGHVFVTAHDGVVTKIL